MRADDSAAPDGAAREGGAVAGCRPTPPFTSLAGALASHILSSHLISSHPIPSPLPSPCPRTRARAATRAAAETMAGPVTAVAGERVLPGPGCGQQEPPHRTVQVRRRRPRCLGTPGRPERREGLISDQAFSPRDQISTQPGAHPQRSGPDRGRRLGQEARRSLAAARGWGGGGAERRDGRSDSAERAVRPAPRDISKLPGPHKPAEPQKGNARGVGFWSCGVSIPVPSGCKPDALPCELQPRGQLLRLFPVAPGLRPKRTPAVYKVSRRQPGMPHVHSIVRGVVTARSWPLPGGNRLAATEEGRPPATASSGASAAAEAHPERGQRAPPLAAARPQVLARVASRAALPGSTGQPRVAPRARSCLSCGPLQSRWRLWLRLQPLISPAEGSRVRTPVLGPSAPEGVAS
eukprot:scaffold2871_cov381-Prasinococcus_capsulatus_cf.AAC.18